MQRPYTPPRQVSIIEIDGGTFKSNTGHNSGIGLRAWREKNNTAMSLGWRVWHYAPEEIIKAGRKRTGLIESRYGQVCGQYPKGAPPVCRNPT